MTDLQVVEFKAWALPKRTHLDHHDPHSLQQVEDKDSHGFLSRVLCLDFKRAACNPP